MHIIKGTSSEQVEDEAGLRVKIQERLKQQGPLDASKIGIVVRKGQVLLWGSVSSERERAAAGEVAAAIAGRLNVMNHIHVFETLG